MIIYFFFICIAKYVMFIFFFFQAEDGIRDFHVTGVQTCALPISGSSRARGRGDRRYGVSSVYPPNRSPPTVENAPPTWRTPPSAHSRYTSASGRGFHDVAAPVAASTDARRSLVTPPTPVNSPPTWTRPRDTASARTRVPYITPEMSGSQGSTVPETASIAASRS